MEGARGPSRQGHRDPAPERLRLGAEPAPMDPAGCPFEEVNSTGTRERECESSKKVTEARIVGESKCDGPRDGVTR